MKTQELIKFLEDGIWTEYNTKAHDEIIQRLLEFDELKEEIKNLKLEELRKFWQL